MELAPQIQLAREVSPSRNQDNDVMTASYDTILFFPFFTEFGMHKITWPFNHLFTWQIKKIFLYSRKSYDQQTW